METETECLTSKCSQKGKICGLRLRNMKFDEKEISEVVELYNLKLKTIHKEINIEGSPERADFRIVFEDKNKKLFISERISYKALNIKRRIVKSLDFLKSNNLERVHPYIRNKKGEYISQHKECFWQIVPFVSGIDLERPEYVYDKWRGSVFADFLIKLRDKSCEIPFFNKAESFSVKDYINELVRSIKKNKPEILRGIQPVLDFLDEKYMPSYDIFPVAYCHGDFHPINMVWGKKDINAVIDWEFTGYKPEIYDVANMIGCIGIEDPNSLTGELVVEFIKKVKEAGIISDHSWKYLLESVVAQRFAWLSEWLRKNDLEMQEMEEEYMKVLIQKQDILRSCWESLASIKGKCVYV